jgi:peptide/nickel transport system substrate-binding protein
VNAAERTVSGHGHRLVAAIAAVALVGVAAFPGAQALAARHRAPVGPQGTITMGSDVPPTSLDPAIGNDDASTIFLNVLYDNLYRYVNSRAVPWLATGAVPSAGYTVWTIHVRPGVKFQDGNPVTAQAVVYSWQRLLNLGQGYSSLFLPYMSASDVSASGPLTVTVHLKAPFSALPEILPYLYVLDPAAVKAHPAKDGETWLASHSAGSGPYEIQSMTPGSQYVLTDNKDYWHGWAGSHPAQIVWKVMTSLSTRQLALLNGTVNQINWLNIQTWRALKASPKVKADYAPVAETFGVDMNTQAGPTKNLWLRKALAAAFPYQAAVKAIFGGVGTPVGGPVPPSVTDSDTALKPGVQNLALAREYLKKGGIARGTTVEYAYVTGLAEEEELGQVLASTMKPLGINIKIVAMTWPTLSTDMGSPATDPSLTALYFQGFYDSPESFLTPQFSSSASGWEDGSHLDVPAINALLAKAAVAPSAAAARSLWIQAQAEIMAQQPAIYVTQVDTLRAYSSNLVWPNSIFGPTSDYYFIHYQ